MSVIDCADSCVYIKLSYCLAYAQQNFTHKD